MLFSNSLPRCASLCQFCSCCPVPLSLSEASSPPLHYIPRFPQAVFLLTLASSLFRNHTPFLLSFSYWSGLHSALAARGTLFSVHSFNPSDSLATTIIQSHTAVSISHILLISSSSFIWLHSTSLVHLRAPLCHLPCTPRRLRQTHIAVPTT